MKKKIFISNLILSIILCFLILLDHIYWLDQNVYDFVISFKTEDVTNMFMILSDIIYLVGVVSILFLIFYKNKKASFLVVLNLGLSFFTSTILKFIFRRNRPIGIALVIEHGYSMPSSHAFVSTAFFGFIAYFIYKNFEKGKLRSFLLLFFMFYVFMIGLSRIYLGVHYASDVLLGFSTGLIYLVIFVKLFSKYIVLGECKK